LAPRNEAFVIEPGDFVLASTWELIRIPADLLGRLESKSSGGCLGVRVHSTASGPPRPVHDLSNHQVLCRS
jgi:dCTP deaminase